MTRSSVDGKLDQSSVQSNARLAQHLDESDILTVDEAADLLRVNRKTLYEVIRLSRPRWALRFGRTIRVSRTALLEAFRSKGGPALGDHR